MVVGNITDQNLRQVLSISSMASSCSASAEARADDSGGIRKPGPSPPSSFRKRRPALKRLPNGLVGTYRHVLPTEFKPHQRGGTTPRASSACLMALWVRIVMSSRPSSNLIRERVLIPAASANSSCVSPSVRRAALRRSGKSSMARICTHALGIPACQQLRSYMTILSFDVHFFVTLPFISMDPSLGSG